MRTNSIGNPVVLSASAPPTVGQVLTAISGSQADWETPDLPPGKDFVGLFEGSTAVGANIELNATRLNLILGAGGNNGTWLLKADVTGIGVGGLTSINGTSVCSFQVNTGGTAITISPAAGSGYTRMSATAFGSAHFFWDSIPSGTLAGQGARFMTNVTTGTGTNWKVAYSAQFVAA